MENKAKKILIEWTINFLNSKASIKNDLKKIEKNKENYDLKAIYDDKEVYIIIEPFIENFDKLYGKIKKENFISIVLFNTIENFEITTEKWKRLIDFENLTIYFVNMFSSTDTKWIIKPYLHDKITDEKSLNIGLKSIFNMVEPITEKEIERKSL